MIDVVGLDLLGSGIVGVALLRFAAIRDCDLPAAEDVLLRGAGHDVLVNAW